MLQIRGVHPAGPTTIPEARDARTWQALCRVLGRACRQAAEAALVLFHCLRDHDTPRWARLLIGGALAYLVLPADLVPDIFPVVGFGDDWFAILGAMAMVAMHIKPLHRQMAREQLDVLLAGWKHRPGRSVNPLRIENYPHSSP